MGVHFGYSDHALDVGCNLFNAEGDFFGPAIQAPRAMIAAAASGHGVFASGGTLIPDFRDEQKVARFVRAWRADGAQDGRQAAPEAPRHAPSFPEATSTISMPVWASRHLDGACRARPTAASSFAHVSKSGS